MQRPQEQFNNQLVIYPADEQIPELVMLGEKVDVEVDGVVYECLRYNETNYIMNLRLPGSKRGIRTFGG